MNRAHGLEIPETLEEICDPRRPGGVVAFPIVGVALLTDTATFAGLLRRHGATPRPGRQ